MLHKVVAEIIRKQPDLAGMEYVLEKEILHLDILDVLHGHGFLNHLTFIGGTALRLCYNSNRLSEDLDFTGGCNFKPSDFDGLAAELQKGIAGKYGLQVTAREPRSLNSDTSTWKVTLETHPGRADLPSQKMHIDVCAYDSLQVQKRSVVNHYDIESPIAGLPIPVQSLEEILADKMVAFAFRERRIKPRDVWDIIWLKQKGVPQNADYVAKKLAMRSKSREHFLQNINTHAQDIVSSEETKRDFMQEMGRFVPPAVSARTLQNNDFYPFVGQVIREECDVLRDLLLGNNVGESRWQL
jgi:predicted nucleotidyltransferase component of viral defense system